MNLKTYLILTGMLAVAYGSYTVFNKPKTSMIPKDLTQRISQEIKHQVMIVCITYSKAMNKIRQDNQQKLKGKFDEVFAQFRNELSQVYVAKQNLILRKFVVTRQTYGKSLQKFKNDKIIAKNISEIFDMMQRAIDGKLPDFSIPKQAERAFKRQDLVQIYKQMVTLIGKKVTEKLQQQVEKNPSFNPASDEDFRAAIRELSIYDIKVNFLLSKGFKTQWGCPNEIFFKYLESEKTKDQKYEKTVVLYEKTYEKIIEIVSADPKSITNAKIDEMFAQALKEPVPVKPVIQTYNQPDVIKSKSSSIVAPVQKKPEPKKQIDQDAELEAMMMQQLLNRSSQAPKNESSSSQEIAVVTQQVLHPEKVGLTQSEVIREDNQYQGVNSPLEQAREDIQVAENQQHLNKIIEDQQKIVDIILQAQNQERQNQQPIEQQQAVEQQQAFEQKQKVEDIKVQKQAQEQQKQPVADEQIKVEEVKEQVKQVVEQVIAEQNEVQKLETKEQKPQPEEELQN